jgi:hypothetical protein
VLARKEGKGHEGITRWRQGGVMAPWRSPGHHSCNSTGYPITLCHWHKVLQAKRPLCVNFLLTRTAGEDRFLAAAASALVFSYFSILGVAED